MKRVLSMIKVALVATFAMFGSIALTPAASAQEVSTYSGCGGNQCHNTPPPTPSGFTFDIFGGAAFQGLGAGKFTGEEGGVLVEKTGYGGVDLTLSAGGNLCGFECQDGGFTFAGNAGEHVNVTAGAFGTKPGDVVSAENMGVASAMLQFGSTKVPTLPQNDD